MSLTVRDIMDAAARDRDARRAASRRSCASCAPTSSPASPWSTTGGRCVGIITEADLVMAGDEGDLHLPHFIELFGGIVFLESMEKLRGAPAAGDGLDGAAT